MRSVLELIREAIAPCPLMANVTEELTECAVYDVYTTGYDGIKRSSMLKLTIRAPTMERTLELESAIDHALVIPGDMPVTETALSARRNGGGWLTDAGSHVRIAYYELITRDVNTKE